MRRRAGLAAVARRTRSDSGGSEPAAVPRPGAAHLRTRERLLTGAAFALTLWAARGNVPLAPLVQQAMRQATFLAAFMMLLTLLKEGAAIALLTLAVGWLEDRFTGARLSAVLSRHEIPVRTAVPFLWRALHHRATSTGPGRRRRRPHARAPECSGAMASDARSGAPT